MNFIKNLFTSTKGCTTAQFDELLRLTGQPGLASLLEKASQKMSQKEGEADKLRFDADQITSEAQKKLEAAIAAAESEYSEKAEISEAKINKALEISNEALRIAEILESFPKSE